MNNLPRYDAVAIGLHWLLAIAILVALGSGLYAASLPVSPARLRWVNWHKWLGIAVLFSSVLRLGWRIWHPPPSLPERTIAHMPGWQRKAHHSVHGLMYALFFAVPLMGWAYSSAAGVSIVWLGVLPLPDFVAVNRELAGSLRMAHQVLAWGLGLLIILHVVAVFKHAVVERDGVLLRMLPVRSRRRS